MKQQEKKEIKKDIKGTLRGNLFEYEKLAKAYEDQLKLIKKYNCSYLGMC